MFKLRNINKGIVIQKTKKKSDISNDRVAAITKRFFWILRQMVEERAEAPRQKIMLGETTPR